VRLKSAATTFGPSRHSQSACGLLFMLVFYHIKYGKSNSPKNNSHSPISSQQSTVFCT
jgi:hypothetical protein